MDLEEIKKVVDESVKGLEGKNKEEIDSVKETIVKEVEAKGFQSEVQVKEAVDTAVKELKDGLEKEILDLKKATIQAKNQKEIKSFGGFIKSALKENEESLRALKARKSNSATFMLTKADEDLDPANWANDSYEYATADRSRGLYEQPFMPVWFRNLLPNTTTNTGTIQYIEEGTEVGAAGVWDGTGAIADLTAKDGTAPTFDSVSKNVIWIAGLTRVKREMLDDVAWLSSYLTRKLTVGRTGLWVAENTQIITAMDAASTAYDGTETTGIAKLIDAAFGQLKDYYYNPSFILMNNRDMIAAINLHQASGSGEFDVPNGVVNVIGNQMFIGGVPVIGAPNVDQYDAYVVDRSATEFISRMSPEVRFFEEDRDNVTKNLVTVRAEERILPLFYDSRAVIKVDLTPST